MKCRSLFLFVLLITAVFQATALPTKLVVRVRGKDAKFIGTNIGGALVIVKNSQTGEVLTSGYTEGGSGNTKLLMETSHKRGDRLTDEKTARFEASLDIKEPVLVDIIVKAPAHLKNAAISGSIQAWLIPGKDIDGEGLIIELPGFIIDVLNPGLHQILPFQEGKPTEVNLKISLTMLCGCTISKGGTWNADQIEVVGILQKDGKAIEEKRLTLSKQDNIFDVGFAVNGKGSYGFTVYAYDTVTKNTGVSYVYFFVN